MKLVILSIFLIFVGQMSVLANEKEIPKKTVKLLKIVDEPKGCFQEAKFPCAIKSLKKSQFFVDETVLHLGKNSILVFYSKQSWRLLEGLFYFKTLNKNQIETNQVSFVANGELMISTDASKTEIYNTNAELTWAASDKQRISPPVGFQNWYGYIGSALSEGVLEPIRWVNFVKKWAPFVGNEAEAQKGISFYKEIWAGNTQQASEYYLSVTKRKIASEEKNQEEKRKRIRENQEENARLKQLFRNRSTGSEFF